ncbi:MAG: hypothetical protein KDD48_03500 [Bdellovibrionales bacterium]|nr:hypothetical protein [Bdellovibrionales bacterium]
MSFFSGYCRRQLRFALPLLLALVVSDFASCAWASEDDRVDLASDRLIWTPTALATPPQKFSFRTVNLGFWHFGFKLNENWDVGFQTIPPFGFFALGPTVRFRKEIQPGLSIGAFGNVGVLYLFVLDNEFDNVDTTALYFGGGPLVSAGNGQRALNFSVLTYGGHAAGSTGYVVIPSVGGNLQVSNSIKLNLEVMTFLMPQQKSNAEIWAVMYGIRLFGGHMHGDIAFLAPVGSGVGSLYKVSPLGIPVLQFGASW